MVATLEKYIVFLFALLIPLNYLGRGLYNTSFSIISLLFILLIIKYKIKFIPIKNLYFFIGILSFYTLALLINCINPTHNYYQNIKLLFFLAILLYIATYIFVISEFQKDNFSLFLKIFFYLSAFISLILILSFVCQINVVSSIKHFKTIVFHDYDFHSKQNMIAVSIAFYLRYYFNNKTKINFLLLLLIYLGVFASHGRTAILIITVGTVIYLAYSMYLKKEFNKQKILSIFSIIFVSLFLVLYISGSKLHELTINTSGRFDGWMVYLKLILEKNTLFGYGLQGGKYVYESKLLGFKHPHNIFIESLFYLGVVGLLLLISLIILYAYSIWKKDILLYDKPLMVTVFISILLMEQGIGSLWGTNHIAPLILLAFLSIHASSTTNKKRIT